MNSPLYFEIQADDISRAMTFYKTIFNWQFEKQDWVPIEYYQITTEGIMGGLLGRPVARPTGPAGTNAAVISMEVENYDATAKNILANGGQEALAKMAVPGRCWQGYYLDTEGNTFGIFEPDENAR